MRNKSEPKRLVRHEATVPNFLKDPNIEMAITVVNIRSLSSHAEYLPMEQGEKYSAADNHNNCANYD